MRSSLLLSLLTLGVAGSTGAACSTGDIAAPGAVAPNPRVGASPLRRLSNVEYLNALADLFPAAHPVLPALPPDIPVAGFENAAEAQRPSDVLVARYEAIANLYADAVTREPESVRALVGCTDWSTPSLASACASSFFATTGLSIFRRPLADDERARMLLRFEGWQAAVDFEGAVQLSLSALLQSPQFLYRPEPLPRSDRPGSVVEVEPYAMASRLSFFLWESGPDAALLDAAAHGALGTAEAVRTAALRMLDDPRAARVFWDFPRQWLGLDRVLLDEHAVRTEDIDARWTAATQASANQETKLFVQNTLASGGTLRDLLTSRRAWVDGEMARVYGLPAPADPATFRETMLPETERAGLLTRASFLAGHSHRGATSPPVRGNGIQLRFLCQLPISPPPGVDLSQPKAAPGSGPQTNRMLFEARTRPAMCQGCHVGLNGFGFGFEKYDAAGHFHTSENGLAIDARGQILGTDVDRAFDGAVELSGALAESETVHACATSELVRYALGRAPTRDELPAVATFTKGLVASRGDLRALLLEIATSPSFRLRLVDGEPTP
jgi:hypothetical protein